MQDKEIVKNVLEIIQSCSNESDFEFALNILENWANKETVGDLLRENVLITPLIYDPNTFTPVRGVLIKKHLRQPIFKKITISKENLLNKVEKYL